MKILDLVQGTDTWLKTRLNHFTASEAPAMMNQSKYMTRNELLKLKKTGNAKPVSDFLQGIIAERYDFRTATQQQKICVSGDDFPYSCLWRSQKETQTKLQKYRLTS